MLYALLALAGFGIGVVSSLLGVGGGIFMVPLLLLSGLVGTAQGATGTSIVGVLASGISGSIGYFLRRRCPWRVSLALVPGALAGSYLGAFLTGILPSAALSLAFGLFLLYPATVLVLGKEPKELVKGSEHRSFPWYLGALVGLLAGTAGSLFGIGGGVIMVPMLLWLGLPMVQAVAGSLLVMVPSAALSTALHAMAGRTHWELGLPLVGGILLGGQLGPALAVRLPQRTLRRLFSLILFYSAANMIRRGLGY
ncbi:MAG: sulfite exporter TauE/SafE family protein [Candidatus Bipolaricaulota bacterium]|nr:sulfite exporter TauE/SafE family protein [Candidatus Bipolaricaulota bacterium]MDW8126913.1 sulfite exporter TauE/SafE family protein [Candidatus Bipolaricaulota bacterium]